MVASSSATYVFDLCGFNLHQKLPVGGNLTLANGILYVASGNGMLYAFTSEPQFRISSSMVNQGGSNKLVLQWPSVAGKTYNVWFGQSLSSPFSVVGSDLQATPPVNTYQITVNPTGAGFYRIEAK